LRLPTLARSRGLESGARSALARVLANPTFELIPLKNALDQAAHLPPGATVSVTASPAKGLEATVELSASLERAGFRAVPHLSARQVRDELHLRQLLAPLADAGIDRAFVVGGDAEEPGEYRDALSLLRAMADLGIAPAEIGIGCYPQGHAFIPDDALLSALRDKAPFAASMTTQLCFDPRAIRDWLAERRAEGIELPVRIGLPGVAEIPKLISISARIGVRDASRFILKNTRFIGQLLRSGGTYRPTALLEGLAPLIADPAAGVIGLHLYTFNQVAATEAWRTGELARLDRLAPVAQDPIGR
jgi:methylenetetrahydrofolate reductase (NADPH)